VPYKVQPFRDLPISPNNPEYSGQVITQPYTLISGDAGAASTIDIEWTMTAEPVKNTTPPSGP
jgi:hypothetical protein